MMRFQYSIHHVPGKSLYVADTLSRAPLQVTSNDSATQSAEEIERFIQVVTSTLPADKDRLDIYAKHKSKTLSVQS